jgi:hypothetical protein
VLSPAIELVPTLTGLNICVIVDGGTKNSSPKLIFNNNNNNNNNEKSKPWKTPEFEIGGLPPMFSV